MNKRSAVLLVAVVLTIVGAMTLIYFQVNPYLAQTTVHVTKTQDLFAGVLYTTSTDIPAGHSLSGTFSYSPISSTGTGGSLDAYQLFILNDTGFSNSKIVPNQQFSPAATVYDVAPSVQNYQGNFVIFGVNQTMMFPFSVSSHESTKYYFVLELAPGSSEPTVTINAHISTNNTWLPNVVGLSILVVAGIFWVIGGWGVHKEKEGFRNRSIVIKQALPQPDRTPHTAVSGDAVSHSQDWKSCHRLKAMNPQRVM